MLDALIIGGGFSGSLLAWRLRRAGHSVLVLDAPSKGVATPAWAVAAGLAAPVSGQRATLLGDATETLRGALTLYKDLSAEFSQQFWRPMPIIRCFTQAEDAQRWQRRCSEPAFAPYLVELDPAKLPEAASLKPLAAAFSILGGGHLNINALVPALQARLEAEGALQRTLVDPLEISSPGDYVQWRDVRARNAIFCEGIAARHNPLFPALAFQATRGEMLELEITGLSTERVLYGRHFLIPLGGEHYLCGATYDREDLESGATDIGRAELEDGLQELLKIPYKIVMQRVGLRPNVRGHTALWQRHPKDPRFWRLNGLGSKGAWTAPGLTLQALREIEEALLVQ
jgi:glycine/D-amino acid oxidase-like deaminating enzyme